MLKRESNGRPGPAGCTSTNRIHYHEHGPTLRPKKPGHIFRPSRFFHAILCKIAPHWSDQLFGIRHIFDFIPTAEKGRGIGR
jgi:hypothetical protein